VIEHVSECSACAGEYHLLHPLLDWGAEVRRALSASTRPGLARIPGWLFGRVSPGYALAAIAAIALLIAPAAMIRSVADSQSMNRQLEAALAQQQGEIAAARQVVANLEGRLARETAANTQDRLSMQQLAQLPTPRLDVPVIALDPAFEGLVRGAPELRRITRPPDAPSMSLVLNIPPLQSRSTLEVEVMGSDGGIRWAGRTQRQEGDASVTLTLPAAGFPPGEYVIRVLDVGRGQAILGTYPIAVQSTAGATP
jgi:hypothetical protein